MVTDLCRALHDMGCETVTFRHAIPDCDVAVFVKFKPAVNELRELKQRCRLVFCPVDVYGRASEIDADRAALACFDRIVIHCERLRKYFSSYAPVEYLDHHLKFLADPPLVRSGDGPLMKLAN